MASAAKGAIFSTQKGSTVALMSHPPSPEPAFWALWLVSCGRIAAGETHKGALQINGAARAAIDAFGHIKARPSVGRKGERSTNKARNKEGPKAEDALSSFCEMLESELLKFM